MGTDRSGKPKWGSNNQFLTLFIFVALALLAVGCKKDPRVEFIQGSWYNKDAHLANIPAESAQETNVVYDNGYFSLDACCFTEMYISGNYTVSEMDENELTLDLYNLKGRIGSSNLNKKDTMIMLIRIDEEAGTLQINGSGPFERISP